MFRLKSTNGWGNEIGYSRFEHSDMKLEKVQSIKDSSLQREFVVKYRVSRVSTIALLKLPKILSVPGETTFFGLSGQQKTGAKPYCFPFRRIIIPPHPVAVKELPSACPN